MNISARRIAAIAGVAGLLLTACGSDDSSTGQAPSDNTPSANTTPNDVDTTNSPASEPDPGGDETSTEPIRLAGYIDLTGPTANVGEPYAQGLRDRIGFANDNGGVNGRPVEITIEDYGYDLARAEQMFTRFVESDKLPFIFTWGTPDVLAQIPKFADAQTPTLSGALAEDLSDAELAPFTFALGPTYAQQFRIAIDFAKSQGATAVGAIAMDTGSGREPLPYAEEYAREVGVEWVGAEIVGTQSADNSIAVRNIANAGADFIIIHQQDAAATTQTLLDAARIGVDVEFITTIWSADPAVAGPDLAGEAAEGVFSVRPFAVYGDDVPGLDPIVAFVEADGRDPATSITLAYIQGWLAADVALTALASIDGEITGPAMKAALEAITQHDTEGLSAPLTFSDSSHVGVNESPIRVVRNGVQELVD